MIEIPAGTFTMGSNDAEPHEQPQHEVYLDRFEIAKYAVTNRQYDAFLAVQPDQLSPTHWNGRTAPDSYEHHPVVNVTWDQAQAYTAWLTQQSGQRYRLPTEAQWEKAARGIDGRTYPWGETFDTSSCNTRAKSPGQTTPIDAYPSGASPYGVMDMAGNVSEWCIDWYQEGYSQRTERNPTGPPAGEHRGIRGGAWRYSKNAARCSARYWCPPSNQRDNLGFRLVISDNANWAPKYSLNPQGKAP